MSNNNDAQRISELEETVKYLSGHNRLLAALLTVEPRKKLNPKRKLAKVLDESRRLLNDFRENR